MKLRNLILELKKELEDSSPTALLDAQLLVAMEMGKDRLYLLTHPEEEVNAEAEDRIRNLAARRGSGVPLQHITGVQEFMGLDFEVGPQVLIPRPDTEILVEQVMRDFEGAGPATILDLGTGSGAISVSLAHYLPEIKVYAVDISAEALATAKRNAASHGLASRVDFLLGNLFEPFGRTCEKADAIVSNPPYIPSGDIPGLQREVADHEPMGALDGGTDGLDFYRAIASEAPRHLALGGRIYLEVGHDQAEDVENLLKQVKCRGESCYNNILRVKDLAGIERVVTATLVSDEIDRNHERSDM